MRAIRSLFPQTRHALALIALATALTSPAQSNSFAAHTQLPQNSLPAITPSFPAQLADVNEIARRVAASEDLRHSALRHYASSRTYHLVYNGIGGEHIADLVVHAQYDAPGVKHLTVVSQTGSKGFGDKVLRKLVESEEEASQRDNRRAMAFTLENFEMHLVGTDTLDGVPAYVLDVKPRGDNKFAYSGRVWISMADFAIIRVQGSPAHEPSFMVSSMKFDTHYVRSGWFWLPLHNQTITHLYMGGEVRITITYGPYQELVASPATMDFATLAAK